MGVPIDGPSHVFGDNMLVIHNTQQPESTLKKKSHKVCYHAVRESVAMDKMLTRHIRSEENVTNLATKVLYNSKQKYLVGNILNDIYD